MIDHRSFPSMLGQRASRHPQRPAVVFINDVGDEQVLDYGELWHRAVRVATTLSTLSEQGTQPAVPQAGEQNNAAAAPPPRALLLFPPGLDFLPAFVGAQLAGWIPVPTVYPKPHRAMPRLDAAARDCRPAAILSDSRTRESLDRGQLDPAAARLPCLAVDTLPPGDAEHSRQGDRAADMLPNSSAASPEAIALLQYTSGSTSEPKGVMVSHRNLMANLQAIRTSFALDWQRDQESAELTTAVFWLPHFHDMGLIGGILAPLYLGYRTVLMSPQSFVRRPIRWLQAIDRYGAAVTGAPNFAFELCADRVTPQQAQGLDLSSLQVTFCGAEPIRAAALHGFARRFATAGFRQQSYYPCYGLAESTLLAAGGKGPAVPTVLEIDRAALRQRRARVLDSDSPEKKLSLVSCGSAAGEGELVIVDPESRSPLPEGRVGEIWLRGPSVAAGYWNRDRENETRFNAALASQRTGWAQRWFGKLAGGGEPNHPGQDKQGYFRTGDLGFFHRGELYITGRIKDLIIIRGRNHFPQDIEATVTASDGAALGRVAAVGVEGPRGEALALVAEVARQNTADQHTALVRQIRRAVIEEHELDPRQVLLVRAATIPVTTSGKLQRRVCQQWLSDGFRGTLHHWQRSGALESPPLPLPTLPAAPGPEDVDAVKQVIEQWIVQWLIIRGGVDAERIDVNQRFEDYGLDSLMAIELIGDLEDGCEVELTPSVAWEHPTIDKMASLVAARVGGVVNDQDSAVAVDAASG